MRICPTCRTAYPLRGRTTCARDGTKLVGAEEYAAARTDPLLNESVAGRFKVKERIGTGGMGTVYRAEQAGLGRAVALKVLKKELVSDRDTVARFHREAKAMSLLMHPNTVRVFDFGEDEAGHLFLAMELLEGELLTAWIEREGAPPVDQAVNVIRQILSSLSEAHSKSIIHRDLKPDNIFLADVEGQADPVVKVLDFGIAKVFRDEAAIDQLETQAGTVFGTPRYMSPEQAQGKKLDHRSDLYAVGVLLYQLLTGQPPFMDDDAVVVMAKHIRDTPDPIRKVAPDRPIPRKLEKVVRRALAKEPDARYEDADAFEGALVDCMEAIALEAERVTGRHTSVFLGARGIGRTPIAIASTLIVAALGVAGYLVLSAQPSEVAEADDGLPHTVAVGAIDEVAATRSVLLTSRPPGAAIFDGERRLGQTPRTFDVAEHEAHQLTLRLDDHEPREVEIRFDSPAEHTVRLEPAAPAEIAEAGTDADESDRDPMPARAQRPRGHAREDRSRPPPDDEPYERFE